MRTKVVTYYLEMLYPADLQAGPYEPPEVVLMRAAIPSPELNRFFYTAVGGDWYWLDRLPWTYAQWQAYLSRPEVETWMAMVAGTPAGYFELELQPEAQVEIVYFGLLPQFVGRGLGSYLLTAALHQAWQMGAARVWLHTCSLDHPRALENYQRRGMRIFKEETTYQNIPAYPPGPWPGAARQQPGDHPQSSTER